MSYNWEHIICLIKDPSYCELYITVKRLSMAVSTGRNSVIKCMEFKRQEPSFYSVADSETGNYRELQLKIGSEIGITRLTMSWYLNA